MDRDRFLSKALRILKITTRSLVILFLCFSALILPANIVSGDTIQSPAAATTITFTGTELLGRPTNTSITIKIVPASTIEYHYQYGTSTGDYDWQTSNTTATGGQPNEVLISGLTANTRYYYRMRYHLPGETDWVIRAEHSFMTQRSSGSTFTFDITTDSHVGIMLGSASTWNTVMGRVAVDHPDFQIDLGDTFAMDDGNNTGYVTPGDIATAEQKYKDQLTYFNKVSGDSPIFLVAGNHEEQEAWHLTASNTGGDQSKSLPVMSKNAEKKYYLNPLPDSFYSSDTSTNPYLTPDMYKQDYFSWTWGDALFVVISPFWTTTPRPYSTQTGGGEGDNTGVDNRWGWTLGLDQFNWLKTTLQNSSAKYKFVFSHQIVGGNSASSMVNYGHGGVDSANLVEWGGYDVGGTNYTWATNRPGWGDQPIRQMMEANGVTAFFHGHDHQMAYEKYNVTGMVYQSVPSSSFTGSFGMFSTGGNSGQTIWADSTQGPGYLRVTVTPSETTVEFVRSNGTIAQTYTMEPNATDTRILGDVNGDALVNSTDALIILSGSVGINIAQFCPINCGDANADGVVNSTDALIILSYSVGMSVPFPVGQVGACPANVTPCAGCNP